ncbi:MAG: LacI family DNA-binding transcriptional regulator [Spirochaetales bacterium]|nr:LacI family DNA-binding transcriptional regulator [Spirochaetales bacterium]
MARVSIQTVAQAAGVSPSTVSRVFNDPDKVQPSTRRAVFDAMNELGYAPPLKHRHDRPESGLVALAVPNLSLDSVIQFFRELQKALLPLDKHLIVLDLEGERNFYEYSRTHRLPLDQIDAVVAFSLLLDKQAAELLDRHTIPAIAVQTRNPFLHSINNNNYAGGFDACSYLLERGYTRPGFVGWDPEDDTLRDRRAGYRAALERAGAAPDDARETRGPLSFDGGKGAMAELLGRPEPPDAVFFACDVMALGGLEACRERGINVPAELGLMGFDDLPQSAWWRLTTMDQHLKDKAEAAVAHLKEIWNGKPPYERPREITISSRVVARGTTK